MIKLIIRVMIAALAVVGMAYLLPKMFPSAGNVAFNLPMAKEYGLTYLRLACASVGMAAMFVTKGK